ncbi:3'-5' exonuclease, partial [Paenibacillus phytohabitans]|uniref:3'-5' exonuclease n=1 Tax=Paenibacillus phytohabitans TaxID=2654978 RepID=UPI00300AD2B4
ELGSILSNLINDKRNFDKYFDKILPLICESNRVIESNSIISDVKEDFDKLKLILRRYKKERDIDERNLGDFLTFISLSPKNDPLEEGVALLTGHAAKGLEYDYVFLVSLNQGVFPDYRAQADQRKLEEERRNCFVAITRTKRKLFISFTDHKNTRFGTRPHDVSQFVREMGLI